MADHEVKSQSLPPSPFFLAQPNSWDSASLGCSHLGRWCVLDSRGSVQFSRSVMSNSLWPHELQYSRPPCPSSTPRACSNSCPLSRWCHPTISSSVIPFSSCFQSFPASGSFPLNQFFASGGQSTGVSASASILPMNIQNWLLLGQTGLISLLSKELSRIFPNTTVQKHQSLWVLTDSHRPEPVNGKESKAEAG